MANTTTTRQPHGTPEACSHGQVPTHTITWFDGVVDYACQDEANTARLRCATTATVEEIPTYARLRAEWEQAYLAHFRVDSGYSAGVEDRAWNRLIDHIEANGLSGSEADLRQPRIAIEIMKAIEARA